MYTYTKAGKDWDSNREVLRVRSQINAIYCILFIFSCWLLSTGL